MELQLKEREEVSKSSYEVGRIGIVARVHCMGSQREAPIINAWCTTMVTFDPWIIIDSTFNYPSTYLPDL